MKIPDQLYDYRPNLIFCFFAPVFALLFVVIYNPTFGLNPDSYALAEGNKGFCIPILCAIELGVLLVSRSLLFLIFNSQFSIFNSIKRRRITEMEFLLWQAIEYVVACLFFDLFLSLYLHLGYFDLLPRILLVSLGINIFPYAFYWVFMERMDRDARIAEAYKMLNNTRGKGDQGEGMVRFTDDKGHVKLVVGADKVISVQSAGNYLTITYDDGGKLLRYTLRNTMKGVEKVCSANGMVRCHRSFFVNVNKVKVIRRAAEGMVAEIDHAVVGTVPVSRTYASDLISLFSEN